MVQSNAKISKSLGFSIKHIKLEEKFMHVPMFVTIGNEVQFSMVCASSLIYCTSWIIHSWLHSDKGACDQRVGLIKGLEKEA